MGKGFLIDTNVLIDAQSRKIPQNGLVALANIINEEFTISFITYIECLGYKDVTPDMHEFVALANVIEINKTIIDMTVDIRKSFRILLPDAIIAASAIVYDRTLVTRNMNDFQKINGLKLENPWTW